jgi:serine/threonine protein kinase
LERQFRIGNYTVVQLVFENSRTSIYRAVRTEALDARQAHQHKQSPLVALGSSAGVTAAERDVTSEGAAETFIVKVVNKEHPSAIELASLKHEFTILQHLAQVKGVIHAVALESFGNGLALILSDFEGEPLSKLKVEVDEVLDIGIGIARALSRVHAHGVIHKDIKPSNIKYNRELCKIQLLDFGISSLLSSESYHYNTANLLTNRARPRWDARDTAAQLTGQGGARFGAMVGTLAYMSPEQTGRMNRVVDYRSDYYSLGATLFELATGRLPFQATHRLEYVHCHMAKV